MFRLSDLYVLFPAALLARVVWAAVQPSARRPIVRLILDALFLTYLIALAEVVLGFARLGGLGDGFSPWSHVNLIPLGSISELGRPELRADVMGQVVGNVLLFVPFGMLLPMTATRFRTLKSLFTTGLLVSAGIEIAQLVFVLGRLMDRAADVDDVLLNTLGAVLGFAIWLLLSRALRRPVLKPVMDAGARAEAPGRSTFCAYPQHG